MKYVYISLQLNSQFEVGVNCSNVTEIEKIQGLLQLRERIVELRNIGTFVKTKENLSDFEKNYTTQYITWCKEVVKKNTDHKNDEGTFKTFAFGDHINGALNKTSIFCELNGCNY